MRAKKPPSRARDGGRKSVSPNVCRGLRQMQQVRCAPSTSQPAIPAPAAR